MNIDTRLSRIEENIDTRLSRMEENIEKYFVALLQFQNKYTSIEVGWWKGYKKGERGGKLSTEEVFECFKREIQE